MIGGNVMQDKDEQGNQVPEIRFRGFSGEWEDCELGDLFEITSASRVHKNEWTESGVPFFRSSDVVADYKGLDNQKAYISFELYRELSNKIGCIKKNDLLITGGGSIGIPYLVKNNDPLYFKDADLLWLKSSNHVNGYYLYTFFLTLIFRKYVNSITHIGTISHYTIEQAKSTPINLPDTNEQTKIGDFFQQIDRLISQHQQKHDKLLNIKKALLEKMFPRSGKTEPEIRFKGFSGEWRTERLEENADFSKGQGYSKADLVESGSPIILYGRLYTKYETVIFKVDTFVIDNGKSIISKGIEVIVPASGETADDIAIASAVVVPQKC
jgi:type I restriction enzyme S subunit